MQTIINKPTVYLGIKTPLKEKNVTKTITQLNL